MAGMITSKVDKLRTQGESFSSAGDQLERNIASLRSAIELLVKSTGGNTSPQLASSFETAEDELDDYIEKLRNVGQALVDAADRHLNEDDSLAGDVSIDLV
ncbi:MULTISPECIES: WXG100 family type VII secretion target [unclassified Butyrivibrio]|uniref:WXG100 family type VII secretion target n=1 Tax=unclassified Butyrivibrio TaxID=2639466 RepID=UPI00041A9390|nr:MULTISPECIES: hypothetical protein [unclassified Butyrivibrio]SCY47313.1 hypothetical protein SAMN02910371_02439 [Butyrivibrio sp. INlla14]